MVRQDRFTLAFTSLKSILSKLRARLEQVLGRILALESWQFLSKFQAKSLRDFCSTGFKSFVQFSGRIGAGFLHGFWWCGIKDSYPGLYSHFFNPRFCESRFLNLSLFLLFSLRPCKLLFPPYSLHGQLSSLGKRPRTLVGMHLRFSLDPLS